MSREKNISKKSNNDKIPPVPSNILHSSVKDKILNQWNSIPVIKENYDSSSFKLMSEGIRSNITDLFRKGIEEYNPLSDRNVIRHVFSAKEILFHIQRELNVEITLQNIYFHLSKLEEAGIITRITSIKEGRHSTHYFGRTARLFVHVGNSSQKIFLNDDKFEKITKLLERLNPDLSIETQIKVFDELEEKIDEARKRITNWMAENEKIIIELNIDFRDIYEMLFLLERFDESILETTQKIAELFKYPVNE